MERDSQQELRTAEQLRNTMKELRRMTRCWQALDEENAKLRKVVELARVYRREDDALDIALRELDKGEK